MVKKINKNVPGLFVGIEPFFNGGSISVIDSEGEIACIEGMPGLSKSDDILMNLGKLIERKSFELQDVAGICVSSGPGSVTGTRIGLAVGKGLGKALEIQVCELTVLDALYLTNSKILKGRTIIVINEAGKGIYYKIYGGSGKSVEMSGLEDGFLSTEAFQEKVGNWAGDTHSGMIYLDFGAENRIWNGTWKEGQKLLEMPVKNLAKVLAEACLLQSASDNEHFIKHL